MESNLVSDEELIKRINDVLNGSKEGRSIEEQLDNSSAEKFHDVSDSTDVQSSDQGSVGKRKGSSDCRKDLELENQILSSQLEAERRKSKELQTKFKLFEKSAKYFERLNGQLETIRQTVEEDGWELSNQEVYGVKNAETMQKLRPKTVHTAAKGSGEQDDADDGAATSSEPQRDIGKTKKRMDNREEIAFRDAEDFKQLEQNMEIVKDKEGNDLESEKVFITKTEKKCLEDIGNLASKMRTPLDDKHQRFFEKDRRRFANRIAMPETQEVDKSESVPPDLAPKGKDTPVNLTSTQLDGLRSYLLQLKELIARRETAWARTTERDYNQRVEITRFKNEVSHLRMLCEKRQKDIKERDQIIEAKEEEIKELQKRLQGLRNALIKLEKKDDRISDALEGLTNEVLENSQLVQRSYNVMKKATLQNKVPVKCSSVIRASAAARRMVATPDISETSKIKSTSSSEECKTPKPKSKAPLPNKTQKRRHHAESTGRPQRKTSIERVDEKLQRIEEMLHSDVLKNEKKNTSGWKQGKVPVDQKAHPTFQQKGTPSNSRIRQEMLGAMTGVNMNTGFDPKRHQGNAAILANALLASRNSNMFNF